MDRAVEAFFLLPRSYFETMLEPGFLGGIQLLPMLGTVGLVAGLGFAAAKPRKGLVAFLLPVIGSGLLVAVLEIAGTNPGNDIKEPLILGFLVSHLALIGFLAYRLREQWPAALPFSLFLLTYVAFATVIATLGPGSFR